MNMPIINTLMQPIVIQYYMILLTGLLFAFVTLFICVRVKHPHAWLKKMYLQLIKGEKAIPYVLITTTNTLTVDVAPRKKFIKRGANADKATVYIPEGDDINISGIGHGFMYFEECSLPLAISATTLRKNMLKNTNNIEYSMLDAKLLGNLIISYAQLGLQSGIAKARKGMQMLQYINVGIAILVLLLVALLYMNQQQIVAALKALLGAVPQTVSGGVEYGIKP